MRRMNKEGGIVRCGGSHGNHRSRLRRQTEWLSMGAVKQDVDKQLKIKEKIACRKLQYIPCESRNLRTIKAK